MQEQQDQQQAASTVVSASHDNSVMNAGATGASVFVQPDQQQKSGRYSIPSPTSPRNGLMSDRTSQTVTSSSAGVPPASTMAAAAPSTSAANASGTMVVVISESCSQRPQLLSPPEEKRGWEEAEVQVIEERIDRVRVQEEVAQSTSTSASIESVPSSSKSSS